MKKTLKGLSRFEWGLWVTSVLVILLSFFLSRNTAWLYLATSLLGATALIFVSKGDVLGQILTAVFSVLYGVISYSYAYYGEMVTYLGMTLPIALASVITWLKNPYGTERREVRVAHVRAWEYLLISLLGIAVSVIFWFVLRWLGTENLTVSTVSVFTSFLAVVLSMRRSAFYALAYAANDVVLIILWVMASLEDPEYSCMVVCFLAFLANDLYGFFNWKRMERRQGEGD